MKIQRPGHSESNILYSNFLKKKYPIKYSKNIEHTFIKWIYKTSGFYDKTIDPENFLQVSESYCYNRLIEEYEQSLYGCDHIECCYGNPSFDDDPPELLKEYIMQFQAKSTAINFNYIYNYSNYNFTRYWCSEYRKDNNYYGVFHEHYNLLANKTVLVVGAFSELIQYQYKNNVKNIFINFPKFDLIIYTTPYTFMNTGPDANFFETLDKLWLDIYELKFDVALLSCGVYAALLIDKICRIKQKDGIYMGRGCNYMFGIDPHRNKKEYPLWITEIPQSMRYERADQIENSIYWGKNV